MSMSKYASQAHYEAATSNYPRLSDAAFLTITTFGLATGSRVIGGATEHSDYDYVLTRAEIDGIDELCEAPRSCDEDYAELVREIESLKFRYGDKIINLILVEDQVGKDAWRIATQMMAAGPDFPSKTERVFNFKFLKARHYLMNGRKDLALAIVNTPWKDYEV